MRLAFLVLLSLSALFSQQTDTLYILETTDVHGNIYPYDYFRDEPAEQGLAKAYSKIIEYRKQHDNVVLLDAGDLLQGTPLIYLFNHEQPTYPNPMILTLNYMGYDAFTVGNHDIEQGLFVYSKAQNESHFPWLSANAIMEDGRSYFKPYTIIERNGIKIGIIGLTTPGIPMWLDESLYPGITWGDMVKYARKHVTVLRSQVDILVGLFHAGFNAEYSATQTEKLNLPNENASQIVAESVPGFDVIFAGHSHREIKPQSQKKNSPLLLNAGSNARNLAVAQIILQNKNQKWDTIKKEGWLESLKDIPPAQSVLQLTDFYHQETLRYIRNEVAQIDGILDTRRSRMEDTPAIELINLAQMQITGAEITFASCFNDRLLLDSGSLKVKEIYSIYPFENYLYTIKMTGEQIYKYIEYSARWYIKNGTELSTDPNIRGYNYDMAEGINYTIIVNRNKNIEGEAENEIREVTLKNGQSLEMDKTYTVALNSYRASGGGGHLPASGIVNPEILWKSNKELRTILIDFFRKMKTIRPEVDNNWRVEY